MNVLDFPDVKIPEGDFLEGIFEAQKRLMETYHEIERVNGAIVVEPDDWGNLDSRQVQMRIKDLMQRTIEEMMEAANCLKLKPWKNTPVVTDETHFYEELADMFHFMIECVITAGLDAKSLTLMYHKKRAVNAFRQDSNY